MKSIVRVLLVAVTAGIASWLWRNRPPVSQVGNRSRSLKEMAGPEITQLTALEMNGAGYESYLKAWGDLAHALIQPGLTEYEAHSVVEYLLDEMPSALDGYNFIKNQRTDYGQFLYDSNREDGR